jgi:hypothetical protein
MPEFLFIKNFCVGAYKALNFFVVGRRFYTLESESSRDEHGELLLEPFIKCFFNRQEIAFLMYN